MRVATSKIGSKTARQRLRARTKPYNVSVAPRKMLGYVRTTAGAGRWKAIEEIGRTKSGAAIRRQQDIGLADDGDLIADGKAVFSYEQAHRWASGWTSEKHSGALRVRDIFGPYVAARRADAGDSAAKDAEWRLRLYVLREDKEGRPLPGKRGLGDREVNALSLTELNTWRDELASRMTRSSVNRIIANFRAALNQAFHDDKSGIETDKAWRRLKSFKNAGGRREENFTEQEVVRLIREAEKEDKAFTNLLTATFYTGARAPGELAQLDVRHFDARNAQLKIIDGKTGPRTTTLSPEGVAFFRKLTEGKHPGEILLPRADGERWVAQNHYHLMRRALKGAGLSLDACLYTLRHTYVSRSLENGMPILMIADNIGSSVGQIEKSYAHILSKVRQQTVAKTGPSLRLVASKARAAA